MLEINTKAPDFSVVDQHGESHSLSEYRGRKLILYFYPKDNTSGCSAQACNYRDNLAEFEKLGICVVGVSKDSVSSHQKFEKNYDLNFTLLSDEALKMVNDYDVYKEKTLYGRKYMGVVRTTYLIDENGVIVYANDKVKAKQDALDMLKIVNRK